MPGFPRGGKGGFTYRRNSGAYVSAQDEWLLLRAGRFRGAISRANGLGPSPYLMIEA